MPEPFTKRVYSLLLANYTLIFLGVGLALCGISTVIPKELELLAHIVRDAGIAALIGIYLMWTLERVNKLRVQQEVHEYVETVGENFIKAVYGRELPLRLFDVIRKSLFNQSFICNVYNVDITIQDFNATSIAAAPQGVRKLLASFQEQAKNTARTADDLVVFKTSSYYEVQNIAQTAEEYSMGIELPKPFGGSYDGLCGITSVRIDGQEQIAADVYYKGPDPGADPTFLRFSHKVLVAPEATLKVSAETYSLRRNEDKEPWQTLRPCKGMNVSAMDSDGNKDIVISLDAQLLEGTESFAVKNKKTNKAMLSVVQYLLPYQGVTVTWAPHRTEEVHQPSLHSELPSAAT